MLVLMAEGHVQTVANEWVSFPGGELEGKRSRSRCQASRACPACRRNGPAGPTLCFQCYRIGLDRERELRNAGERDTGSESRFQSQLPFEPVNRLRLEALRAERARVRMTAVQGTGRYVHERRQAQIAARRAIFPAIRAVVPQLPKSWLPFVVSR
jgi:hypothetical protein